MEAYPNDSESTVPQFRPNPDGSTPTSPGQPLAGPGAETLSGSGQEVPGFVIEAELGRGGMGVVYRAIQTHLNRTVALKMVLSGEFAGRMERLRFLSEAEAVASVRHPHVIQVYEFGEENGRPFFAMEYLTGGSLTSRLKEHGLMAPTAAAELVARLADGVDAVHKLGIVHRDLKPDNILFDANNVPKIVDFGLAKRGSTDLTATGAIMGTPSYMAPEQAAGRTKYSGLSVDVYSLGVILFECLTGRVPFRGDDLMSLLRRIQEEDPPRPRDLNATIPRDLEKIVLKCLAKNPLQRYPSASSLAEDLRRHLNGLRPLAANRSTLGEMWSVLERGRQAGEFAAFSNMFLWLAMIMVVADCAMGLWIADVIPPFIAGGLSILRVIAVPLVVYWYAGKIAVDGSASSRFLLSLWTGLLIACVVLGVVNALISGHPRPTGEDYEHFALLTGVAFFALGANYWGWCYAFGLVFLLSPIVMRPFPLAAAFIYAFLWIISLISISSHLRRLSKEAGMLSQSRLG